MADRQELAQDEREVDHAARVSANGDAEDAAEAAANEAAVRRAEAAGPQAYGPMLLASFTPLARQLFGTDGLREVLAQVLKFTVGAVAGCDRASVTLYQHGLVVDTVSSDAVAADLDDIEFATGIGPAAAAMDSEHPVYVADLTAVPRWPVLAATAAELGVSSALCYGVVSAQAGPMVGARCVHSLQCDTGRVQR